MSKWKKAQELIATALVYDGERVTGPGDLPDDLDALLELSQYLGHVAKAAVQVRQEVDEAAAAALGPGVSHRYGEYLVAWKHGWKWKAYPEAAKFVTDVARHHPEMIVALFNVNAMRKTGIEKTAKTMGLDPEVVVNTVLTKVWEDAPRLQWKWQPEEGEQHDRTDDPGATEEPA